MKLFSFTVSPAKPWLMLPVDNAGKKVDVAIACGDTVIKSFDMKLANGKAADWFTPIPVGAFSGKTLTVSINDDNAVHTQYCYCAATPWPKDIYKESLRPRLRFSPALGWTNDPNGLVFYKGEYHLFFQHNPYGTDWGNMTWGHAVSKDLLHWKELGDALHPDKFGTMFSGSAVVDVNNTSGFGTEQNPPMVLIYTAAGKPFTQCIAYSLNGRTFTKYDGNPVVPNQTDGNRDPKVYWNDKTQLWTMLFYVGHPNQVHTVEFWTSPNLKEWTKVSVYPGDCNGNGFMYECPDYFELPIEGTDETRWVVIAANAVYAVGKFDGTAFTPEVERLTGTQGCSYAAQTYFNMPDGRRIMLAWLRAYAPGMRFNQSMSVPHELGLVKTSDGIRLTRKPFAELASLRGEPLPADAAALPMPCELHVVAKDGQPASFKVGSLSFAINPADAKLTVNGRVYDWIPNKPFDATLYFDTTAVEIFSADGLVYIAHEAVTPAVETPFEASANLAVTAYPLQSILP